MDSYALFNRARSFVGRAPEGMGRAVFTGVGLVAGALPIGGVKQMRKNYSRIDNLSTPRLVCASMAGMANYMRYYYEIFRQEKVSDVQLAHRTWLDNGQLMRQQFADGKPVIAALLHAGNWDLAGAWAEKYLTHVVTVAEKLADPRMAEGFLSFREGLGMKIYLAVKGSHVIESLEDEASEPVLIPLLADRDLTLSGVRVRLCGHEMLVAPGPALLAVRTGGPIFPLVMKHVRLRGSQARMAGTRWGNQILALDPIYPSASSESDPETIRHDVERMCQEWMDRIEPWMKDNYRHWHMLQKVFVSDLDPERLARRRG